MHGTGMGKLIELDSTPFQDKSDVFRGYPLVGMVPFNYIIMARLMNAIKDPREIQATPPLQKVL